VIDGAGSEVDRERDGAALRELVSVQPERKTGLPAGLEV